jgi:SAM-dependent methyltransferase
MSVQLLRRVVGRLGGRYLRAKFEEILTTRADRRFDRRFATETTVPCDLADLEIASENKTGGVRYEPTQVRPFLQLMKLLHLDRRSTFVDFGCGKGRALLLAAEYGFDRVVGVEFAADLCETARRNVETYVRRSRTRSRITVLHEDATQYRIQASDSVFYMYNPFSDDIMRRVIGNIRCSINETPRQVHVIYLNPLCRRVVEGHSGFRIEAERLFHRSRFVVYTNG